MPKRIIHVALGALLALIVTSLAFDRPAFATGAREEGRLLLATEVLEDIQGMPDQRVPDALLARAYGIAVIPDVTKIAFMFGGQRGHGVLAVRQTLTSPWSNPSFITLTGGSWGLQAGAQAADIILVFTTKSGIEGIAGGKLTLGADASAAAGPVGRQSSAATDTNFDSEIYSYSRSRGLFAGIALDGSVIQIDAGSNADFYNKRGVMASELFSGQAPAAPPAAKRFLERLARATQTTVRASPVAQADMPAETRPSPSGTAPVSEPARTYPLEDQSTASAAAPAAAGPAASGTPASGSPGSDTSSASK
jgi:lipid-binding SYLF domain-containing protein